MSNKIWIVDTSYDTFTGKKFIGVKNSYITKMTRIHNMNLYFKDPYEMTHFSILLSVAMLFDLFQHFVNNDTIFFCFY